MQRTAFEKNHNVCLTRLKNGIARNRYYLVGAKIFNVHRSLYSDKGKYV